MNSVNESAAGIIHRLGVQFQGQLDVATMKEVAMYAADLSVGPPGAKEYTFTAHGMLYGVTKARKLRKLAMEPVVGAITMKEIDKFDFSRTFYPPFNDSTIAIESLATCSFTELLPYGKYVSLMELINKDGLLQVSHEAHTDIQTTTFDLSMDFTNI